MRTDNVFETRNGSWIEQIAPLGLDILNKGTNRYFNFNTLVGINGYGIRDNSGVMEFKDLNGSWLAITNAVAGANAALSNLSGVAINTALIGVDGTVSAPAFSFTTDPTTGLYHTGTGATGSILEAINGVAKTQLDATGFKVMTNLWSAGFNWTLQNGTSGAGWRSTCYGNGIYAACSSAGTIMTSQDAFVWKLTSASAGVVLRGMIYANGLFIAVGNGAAFTVSTDGVTWANITVPSDSYTKVSYGNGVWVAVGGKVSYSYDGYNWTQISAPLTSMTDIVFGNGVFVAGQSLGGVGAIMSSTDGVNWTQRTLPTSDNGVKGLCYGSGMFVAVCDTGTGDRVMTSVDGTTWVSRVSPADNIWRKCAYGNGLFVAVASTGTGNRVMTSPDGVTWTLYNAVADLSWYDICFYNGIFVAVALDAVTGCVMTSGLTNGIHIGAGGNFYGIRDFWSEAHFHGNVGIGTTTPNAKLVVSGGSAVIGTVALATNATDGFLYIPTMTAGVPSGVPTAQSGTIPLVFDTTNGRLWVYYGGTWT